MTPSIQKGRAPPTGPALASDGATARHIAAAGVTVDPELVSMTETWRVRTRTAVLLVGGAVLLLAVPFAYVAWAFGGVTELLAFVLPLALLVGLMAVIAVLAGRPRRR